MINEAAARQFFPTDARHTVNVALTFRPDGPLRPPPVLTFTLDDVPGATHVDAGGLTLMPGLIDAHVHVESSLLTPARSAMAARSTSAWARSPAGTRSWTRIATWSRSGTSSSLRDDG